MKTKNDVSSSDPSFQDALTNFAGKLKQSKVAREGEIVFNLSNQQGNRYSLAHDTKQVMLQASAGVNDTPPLIEVIADQQVIQDILEGRKDPLKQFAGGKLRVRGDLRYLSDLALDMKLISKPL